MKRCSKCGIEKPLGDFAKSAAKKDGRTYACKVCLEIDRKARLAADPERAQRLRELDAARKRQKADEIYQKIRARKESDAGYAERLKSYARKYAEKNREKELERGRNYRQFITGGSETREEYNAYMREWVRKNSERINTARRERLKTDPEYAEKVRARDRARYAADPFSHRSERLKSVYGITLGEYMVMYASQDGKCAICGNDRPCDGKDGLVVDHCHTHGHVRKLLCVYCNTGLGQFKDDVQILQKAIDYLKGTQNAEETA